MTDQRAQPCAACPWLTTNQGKPHPDGWYTKKNLTRLWAGMRRGEHMSCHPTDPRNEPSDRAKEQGYKAAPEGTEQLQCIGAAIAVQREVMVAQHLYDANFSTYHKARPRGLTKRGFAVTITDFLFGGTIFSAGGGQLKPDLNADVTVPGLDWPL